MTDLATLARTGLTVVDQAVANCPANTKALGRQACPKCGAKSNESCPFIDVAHVAFVELIRANLKGEVA